ncbi:sel1 repeat family protein [Polynucleobacter paneuropaeus]|nr:sel1 repeat family protein [Polynucleobacter paneuropaeus]
MADIYHSLFTSKDVKILEQLSANSSQDFRDFKYVQEGLINRRKNREEEQKDLQHEKELSDFKTKYIGYKIENLSCEYRGIKQDLVENRFPFHCYPGVGNRDLGNGSVVWVGIEISQENASQLGAVYPGDKFKVSGTIKKVSYAMENFNSRTLNFKDFDGQAEVLLSDGWVKGKDMSGPPSKKETALVPNQSSQTEITAQPVQVPAQPKEQSTPAAPPAPVVKVDTTSVSECDELAGSPMDPQKKTAGVPYDKIDAIKAANACQKAVKIEQSNSRLWFELGRALEKGDSINDSIAAYQKGAELGSAAAYNNIGELYRQGKGFPKDKQKAVEYFKKAADLGSEEGKANLASTKTAK